jgi:hypothetical protein
MLRFPLRQLHTLLMSQHRSAEEFLAPRRTLVANANSVLVDKLDEDLPRLIEADADQASSGHQTDQTVRDQARECGQRNPPRTAI